MPWWLLHTCLLTPCEQSQLHDLSNYSGREECVLMSLDRMTTTCFRDHFLWRALASWQSRRWSDPAPVAGLQHTLCFLVSEDTHSNLVLNVIPELTMSMILWSKLQNMPRYHCPSKYSQTHEPWYSSCSTLQKYCQHDTTHTTRLLLILQYYLSFLCKYNTNCSKFWCWSFLMPSSIAVILHYC